MMQRIKTNGMQLPVANVFVVFSNGLRELVATQDSLSFDEAAKFAKDWSKRGTVHSVDLVKEGYPTASYVF